MPIDSVKSPKTIGIECESIENDSWGVARLITKLLEQLALRPDLASQYHFVLYFNKQIPDLPFLHNPLFTLRVVGLPRWKLPSSFSLYYYMTLPLQLWWDRVDLMYWPNYMLPLIAPRPSLVMLTEDIWFQIHNKKLAWRYRIAYMIFGTWAALTANRIMAISHSSSSALQKLFDISPTQISVNKLAVDAPQATTPKEGRYFLYVGQAFERRHLRETIQAFERLATNDPSLNLVAIGPDKYDPPCIEQLVKEINTRLQRPAIKHLPRVSGNELASFYAGALACVYISDMEAFGLPPLEALSYGTPPIVADKPVNREIYGDHALYVSDPNSIKEITKVMEQVLTDQTFLGHIRQAAPSIISRYTWPAHTNHWLEIVKNMTS